MPGKRVVEKADFVTPRRVYREDVTGVDAGGVADTGIPILDSRETSNTRQGLGPDSAQYGHSAQLNLACIPEGFSSVTLQLWLWANVEEPLDPGMSSSSYGTLPATEEWVEVAERVIGGPELWTVKDVPPGQYKVIVTAVSGSGHLQIREQHAA